MKKLFSLFAVALMAVMIFTINAAPTEAASPKTYMIKYDDAFVTDQWDWIYQEGNQWNEDLPNRELYYLTLDQLKDGDHIIVLDDEAPEVGEFTIDYNLGSLTFTNYSSAIGHVKSVQNVYVCDYARAIVNGPVNNAYVYKGSIANFNGDVNLLEHYYKDELDITVGVGGKLNRFYVHTDGRTKYNLYAFTGPLLMEQGDLKTHSDYYLTTPPAGTTTPSAPTATTPSAPAADEYDEVPKTGDSLAFLWAFGLAAVCFAGSYSFKKRA